MRSPSDSRRRTSLGEKSRTPRAATYMTPTSVCAASSGTPNNDRMPARRSGS